MENQHKAALAKCNLFIKKNITNIGEVLDNLLQNGCLEWEERSKIGQEKSIDEQCQILLEILIRRGGTCYQCFVDALNKSGNNHIVVEIENTTTKIADGEKATITMEALLDDKNRNLEQIKSRVHDLEGKLNKKKEKLDTVHDQQLRALEDIKKFKEKNNHKETEIKILEVKTTEMEKEINQLKQTIDYLQKQITLKDMALKRAVDEKGKIVAEHTKTLQIVEKKQDLTLRTCEKMAVSLMNLTATVGSLRWDIQGQQQQQQGPAVPDTSRNPAPKGKSEVFGLLDKNFGSSPRKMPTCRFGDAVVWKTKKVPPEIGRNKRKY